MGVSSVPQFALNNLTLRSRQEILKQTWDQFAEVSPYAWLYHTYDMQDAIATWPGKHDMSFALVDEEKSGQIVAIVPLHRVDRPFLGFFMNCSLESMGGFAYHPQLTPKQMDVVAEQAMQRIREFGKKNSAEEIRFQLSPLTPFFREPAASKINPLIYLGVENIPSQTYLIDLSQSIESIWNNMDGYCRTHIRKAEKTGYAVRQAVLGEDLEIYYDLHCRTYHRTGVTPHPHAYFEAIWKDFVSSGRAVVFFAELDGKVVAADNEAVYKKAVSGWTAAGEGKATTGVNNLLHWTAIRWAKENDMQIYESGEGFPGEMDGKRKGLTDFKKSFGGELCPLYRGRILCRPALYHFRGFLKAIR